MINLDKIECLIITSSVKSIPEIDKNIIAFSTQTKNENFLYETLKNIEKFSKIKNFVLVHDFKIDSNTAYKHHKNILKLSSIFNIKILVSPSSTKIPSQISATNAFKLGIESINNEFFLFWEHDHLFKVGIDWNIINDCISCGARMIRFNRNRNPLEVNKTFINDLKNIENNIELVDIRNHKDDFLRTNHYSNGPFISETEFCKRLWKDVNFSFPNWNGTFGGFIEGPVNQKMMADEFNLPRRKFLEKYPIYIYGGLNKEPIVFHRGNYEPKYLIKGFRIINLYLFLKSFKNIFIKKFFKLFF